MCQLAAAINFAHARKDSLFPAGSPRTRLDRGADHARSPPADDIGHLCRVRFGLPGAALEVTDAIIEEIEALAPGAFSLRSFDVRRNTD